MQDQGPVHPCLGTVSGPRFVVGTLLMQCHASLDGLASLCSPSYGMVDRLGEEIRDMRAGAQVNKAVWADVQQWRGWLMCVQQTLPDSLPVLLQVTPNMPCSHVAWVHDRHSPRLPLNPRWSPNASTGARPVLRARVQVPFNSTPQETPSGARFVQHCRGDKQLAEQPEHFHLSHDPKETLLLAAQLPLANLGAALQQMPGGVAARAAAYLDSPQCGPLPRQTQALVRERAAAACAKEFAGKQAAAAAAAKEAVGATDAAASAAAAAAQGASAAAVDAAGGEGSAAAEPAASGAVANAPV